ncbi:MAG: hypothetical protein AABZ47_14875 [Planctomycetota bacterium]
MQLGVKGRLAIEIVLVSLIIPSAFAQPEDATIDTIRDLQTISQTDQGRIREWVQKQVEQNLAQPAGSGSATFTQFRSRLQSQYTNSKNSPAFRSQLAAQTAVVVAAELVKPNIKPAPAEAMARVLLDMNGIDTFPGLLAGLKCSIPAARYLCLRGLTLQKENIAKDKQKLTDAVVAIQTAGVNEDSPIILSQTYRALAYSTQVADVLPAYLALFDHRLSLRRERNQRVAGAELDAFEFFRTPGVANALSAEQKAQLAQRVAVFLRLDAERYSRSAVERKTDGTISGELESEEVVGMERSMEAAETVLISLGAGKTAGIADELGKGGHARRAEVLAQAHKWVGNSTTKEQGILNAAPWNVPIGAP